MTSYVVKRVLAVVPVLIIVATVVFTLMHLTPGDPAAAMLGSEATEEQILSLRHQMGLDKPLLTQFIVWFGRALTGDLGTSYYLSQPVVNAITERLPVTLGLAAVAQALALIISIPCGIVAATKRNSVVDKAVMLFSTLGLSVPSFLVGFILILVVSVRLRWLPVGGYVGLGAGFREWISHLLLPGFALGAMQAALIARITRSSMLEVLNADFVRTARSKGLSERVVVWKHALKNAMIPIVTVVGMTFGILAGGAVIVERVFNLPGIGQLMVNSVMRRDYPVIQGVTLYLTMGYVIVNLLVDVLYVYLDPRVKYM